MLIVRGIFILKFFTLNGVSSTIPGVFETVTATFSTAVKPDVWFTEFKVILNVPDAFL